MQKRKDHVDQLGRLQETLSYKATLKRGYAVIRSEDKIITRKSQADPHKGAFAIEFSDGIFELQPKAAKARTKSPLKSDKDDTNQGSLFWSKRALNTTQLQRNTGL